MTWEWSCCHTTSELADNIPDPWQPLEVIRLVMLLHLGNHVLQFFDKGIRFGLMLRAWHERVPARVTAADMHRSIAKGMCSRKTEEPLMTRHVQVAQHQHSIAWGAPQLRQRAVHPLGIRRVLFHAIQHRRPHWQDRCSLAERLALVMSFRV